MMENAKLGQQIKEFDTSLSQVIFKRVQNWVLMILVGISLVLGLNLAEAGIQNTFPNLTQQNYWIITAAIGLFTLAWTVWRLFLRKLWNVKVFREGLMLTEKKGNVVKEVLFAEIEEVEVMRYNKDFRKLEAIIYLKNSDEKIVLKTDEFYKIEELCTTMKQVSKVPIGFGVAAEFDVI